METTPASSMDFLTREESYVSTSIQPFVDTPLVRTVTVSEKGQLVLPADVRKLLGIAKGTQLVLVCDGQRLLLQKEGVAAAALQEDFSDLLAMTERTLQPMWENEDDAAWDHV